MPLSKEQLMIPRVLCIGGKEGEPNYPGSMVKTGEILTHCTGITNGRYYESKDGHLIHLPLNFPNCFKPLPWWEKRDESEMPEYIWPSKTYGIVKVDYWEKSDAYINGERFEAFVWEFEPADLSDYQEYQKQKEA